LRPFARGVGPVAAQCDAGTDVVDNNVIFEMGSGAGDIDGEYIPQSSDCGSGIDDG
jgi:hypothetical protein